MDMSSRIVRNYENMFKISIDKRVNSANIETIQKKVIALNI